MGAELERVTETRPDLRVPVTDSWTDVLQDVITLAQGIAGTEFVPAGLRGSVQKTSAAILTSRELGLPPMTGLSSIHVINGRPGISAELMRGLILQAGHELHVVEVGETRCVIRGRRAGTQDWSTASYTMAEAIKAGDAKKNPNYQSRPQEMLLARATTRLARMLFADVIHGLRAVEELESEEPERTVTVEQGPLPVQRVGRARRSEARQMIPAVPVDDVQDVQDAAQEATSGAPVEDPAPVPVERPAPPRAVPDPALDMPLGAAQRARIHAQANRLGIDRDSRLHLISLIVGRTVESSNDLTRLEARQVITLFERSKDADELAGKAGAGDEPEPAVEIVEEGPGGEDG